MFRFAVSVGCACAVAAAATAQGPPNVRCRDAPAPFALSAGNQIKGSDLMRRLAGKTMVYTRPSVLLSGAPGVAQYRIAFRDDGSMALACRVKPAQAQAWRPCAVFGPKPGTVGDRDVGAWRVEGDQLVWQRTRFGDAESRLAFHAQGDALAVRRIAGAPCAQGPVSLE